MSLISYSEYEPSSVSWLSQQPKGWQAKPLKTVASINDETLTETTNPEEEIQYVDIGSVSLANGIEKTEAMTFGSAPSRARRVPREGDVLVSTVRTYLKAIAPVQGQPGNLVASTGFAVVRAKPEAHPPFLKYALQEEHFIQEIISRSTGVSYPAINASDVGRVLLCVPSKGEQLAIANFLDRETAKIDALIAEQERLIELLQEKRQAVISHAVAKGLNPDAPMKDSGVEWLGEVPEHWSVKRIKHLCISIEQGWSPQCESEASDGAVPGVLKVGCVNGGVFRPSENKILPVELHPLPQYRIKAGDLLVSRANTKELVGSAAVVESDFPWLYICDKLYRIAVDPKGSTTYYLALYLASNEARGQIELGASGASQSMQNISQSVLLDLPIPLPPPEEQEQIRESIQSKCDQINKLTLLSREAILLLQERRSALISAAVTGQIDVRGLDPEEEAT